MAFYIGIIRACMHKDMYVIYDHVKDITVNAPSPQGTNYITHRQYVMIVSAIFTIVI